jgi:hypothetical protein
LYPVWVLGDAILKKLKPEILVVKVSPEAKKLGREYIQSFDVLK